MKSWRDWQTFAPHAKNEHRIVYHRNPTGIDFLKLPSWAASLHLISSEWHVQLPNRGPPFPSTHFWQQFKVCLSLPLSSPCCGSKPTTFPFLPLPSFRLKLLYFLWSPLLSRFASLCGWWMGSGGCGWETLRFGTSIWQGENICGETTASSSAHPAFIYPPSPCLWWQQAPVTHALHMMWETGEGLRNFRIQGDGKALHESPKISNVLSACKAAFSVPHQRWSHSSKGKWSLRCRAVIISTIHLAHHLPFVRPAIPLQEGFSSHFMVRKFCRTEFNRIRKSQSLLHRLN